VVEVKNLGDKKEPDAQELVQHAHLFGLAEVLLLVQETTKITLAILTKNSKLAFAMVLSQKLREKEIIFIDKISLTQPKTKEASALLKNLDAVEKGVSTKSKILVFADASAKRAFQTFLIPNFQHSRI